MNFQIPIEPMLGLPPLNYACYIKAEGMLDLLLEAGADVNGIDYTGSTPLHCAASSGFLEGVDMLLRHDCNVNDEDNYTFTPIMRSIINGHVEVVKRLLQHDPTTGYYMNDECISPLILACMHVSFLMTL